MIWVNGYVYFLHPTPLSPCLELTPPSSCQYGKYVPHIGPQTRFPVPPGVINNRGLNTLALSLWAQTDAGANLREVKLIKYDLYQTGFDFQPGLKLFAAGVGSGTGAVCLMAKGERR